MRRSRILAMCGVFAAVTLLATPVYADDFRCDGDVYDGYYDNVYVVPGTRCRLFDTTVKGNIFVPRDARLRTRDSHVEGNIQAYKARWVRIIRTYVSGNVLIYRTDGGASRVRNSRIYGNIEVKGNYVSFEIENNYIAGNVEFYKNENDEFVIAGNKIKGNLLCYANTPPPDLGGGDPNMVDGNAEGQCRRLAYMY